MKLTVPPKSLRFALAWSLFSAAPAVLSAVNAGEDVPPGNSHDETERHFLLEVLEEQTQIATKTGLNADYVPGIVTILHGSDLERRGFRTVWEALALVPGVNLSIEPVGRRQVTVRGIGGSIRSGKIKLLLNNVAMNSVKHAVADPVLNIPVEQVERIEVIRGPGSAVHGEFAYAGVINVQTRQQQKSLFVAGGSHDTRSAGAAFALTEGRFKMGLNLVGLTADGVDVATQSDALHSASFENFSNAPGPANEKQQVASGAFDLGYRGFSLLAHVTGEAYGDHFGINQILPPDPDWLAQREHYQTLEARQEVGLTRTLTANLTLGRVRFEERREEMFLGPAEAHYGQSGDPDIYLNGLFVETRDYGGVELRWLPAKKHALLLSANYSDTQINTSWEEYNIEFTSPTEYRPSDTFMRILTLSNAQRIIRSASLQDEYRLNDAFTLTTGVRYDDYSDVGHSVTPRIAGVWRLGDQHIVKAQYADAFRPATFYELATARETIPPEEITTYELGYIFKGLRNECRLTTFRSDLKNLVSVDDSGVPRYYSMMASSRGTELEFAAKMTASLRIDGSLSFVDTLERSTNQPIPASVRWLGNLGVLFEPHRHLLLAVQFRYVDEAHREYLDDRAPVVAYQTVDLTATLNDRVTKGMSYRLGVKNLLDQEVHYPSPLTNDQDYNTIVAYENDFPRSGRTWWAQVSYRY